jgi:hypothetical protein
MTALQPIANGICEWPREPYKGLNYFSTTDAPLFSQREDDIDEVAALISNFDTRVLLLHGIAGAGKSSFLRAGLIPRMQKMPPEFGRNFFFLQGACQGRPFGNPLLIRATDDPVARIREALLRSVERQSDHLPDSARVAIRRALTEPLLHDRLKTVPSILAALKALTAPQRDTYVLLIDQAEEVLTLSPTQDATNTRQAFFELLEQICFRHLDLRVIVALRTEYYGRFCSFFMIRPTNKLTPTTEARAGLMDYLLRGLHGRDIAAAIRHPTLNEEGPRKDGLPQPRSVYKFVYEGDLPEIIAADLVRHSGEASTLPAMQIVCKQLYEHVVLKGQRTEITEQDYIRFGRADGAIDSFLVRALRDAAAAANLSRLSDTEVDSWALVLSHVVGRTEGGTVQTLIASEQDLLAEASKHGITNDASRAMLNQMVDSDRPLLRLAGGEGGVSAYSLGHDSLGPTVLRRSAQAAVRAAADAQLAQEREKADQLVKEERYRTKLIVAQERYRAKLIMAGIAFLMVVLTATGGIVAATVIRPLQEKVTVLTNYAKRDPTNDFRLRLLLLAAALNSSETWLGSKVIDAEPSKTALREALLRSPVHAGTFEAGGWDAKGRRVIRLEDDKLVLHNLTTGKDGQPSEVPAEAAAEGFSRPPSIGLITLQGGVEKVIVFRNRSAKLLAGEEGSTLVEHPFELPDEFRGPGFLRSDIFGNHLRVIFTHWFGSVTNRMDVLQLSESLDPNSRASRPNELDWHPRRGARQPVLAEDCDTYAFLGRNDESNREFFTLWVGRLGNNKAKPKPLKGQLIGGAVAITRGCDSILVRDDSNLLHIVRVRRDDFESQSISLASLPPEAAAIVSRSTGQFPTPLAAASLDDRRWRVAWETEDGLAVVDIAPGEVRSSTLLNDQQMLTGFDAAMGPGSLSISPDGLFALIMRQRRFSGPVQLRAFNLDFGTRRDELARLKTTAELVREACRIAQLQNGSNQLSITELVSWLGEGAPQPCGRPMDDGYH